MNNVIYFKNVYYEHEIKNLIPLNKMDNVVFLCANKKLSTIYNNITYTFNSKYQNINDYVNYYTNVYYVYDNIQSWKDFNYIGITQSHKNIQYDCNNLNIDTVAGQIAEFTDKTTQQLFPQFYTYLYKFLDKETMEFVNNHHFIQMFSFICEKNVFKDFVTKSLVPFFDRLIYLIDNKKLDKWESRRNIIISACCTHITYYFYKNYKLLNINDNIENLKHDICHEDISAI